MPARRRSRGAGAERVSPTLSASPAAYSRAAIASSSNPNSLATASLLASDWAVSAKAGLESAQTATPPAPAAGTRSTGSERSLSGTTASQARTPRAAAASAPRDWVSRIASIAAPMPG